MRGAPNATAACEWLGGRRRRLFRARRREHQLADGDDTADEECSAPRRHRHLEELNPTAAAGNPGRSPRHVIFATDGTSYRDAVHVALEDSAGRMLKDCSRTIKEISAALGFADATAFHRAFKRWTGVTPGEYRRAHCGE